jgi:hypothetical protein
VAEHEFWRAKWGTKCHHCEDGARVAFSDNDMDVLHSDRSAVQSVGSDRLRTAKLALRKSAQSPFLSFPITTSLVDSW